MIRIEGTTTVDTVLVTVVCGLIVASALANIVKFGLEIWIAQLKRKKARLAGELAVRQFAKGVSEAVKPTEDCPFCGIRLEALAGNPLLWPAYVCDGYFRDPPDPGKGRNYCTGCVARAVEKLVKEGR